MEAVDDKIESTSMVVCEVPVVLQNVDANTRMTESKQVFDQMYEIAYKI